MNKGLKRLLIGRPLKNEEIQGEKFGVLWGLPILSSDAISSVAYAGQEILLVLLPIAGFLAFKYMAYISLAIIVLLGILTLSYRQTIDCYPNGGGAYVVAKENIGLIAGVTAGSSLCISYILTVAVSIASGVQQIVSAFPVLKPYTSYLCVLVIILMTLGNLRGIKESAKLFSLPTYFFIFSILLMLVVGVIKIFAGYKPEPLVLDESSFQPVTLFLILSAFTNGCAALTGVEAVSNSVPNFKAPSTKNAKAVLALLSTLVLIVFGGTSIIVNYYPINPEKGAMLVQIAQMIFGRNIFFYTITVLSFAILVLAANTAYFGFPNLISVMAREGYVPRQLSMRGDRLSFSNGIISLSAIAALLILIFNANVTRLIGLYAIGVFISFTLSQAGMFFRWIKNKGDNWVVKAAINGFGAFVTFVIVIVIAITKFTMGAWIVVIVIPVMIFLMLKVKTHYMALHKQLKISPEELKDVSIPRDVYTNRVIVPIASINRASIRALRYARTISDNVVAFNVSIDEEQGKKVREKYNMLDTDIPLIVKYSPFRRVVEPLLMFIESAEYDYQKGDIITVILPQFVVKRWWNNALHNHTRAIIERQLIRHKHIVICTMPLQMKDDDRVLKSHKYK
ncbi:APC family permease [Ruminiclostridium cellobioparum]|uniref:Amino acid transporter n=1 Tax=Ruminiclostridium cellobioparum subsp. termitidis CT1112 TaxID=1195236 RepID=S0FN84_RUMCE|nr:APC family permease [Ruminiclostridium cellobioparum]EMS73705.1 amino acid transporter [Ruminiclostridium cellobioparum subsp. termitidis CT1112]